MTAEQDEFAGSPHATTGPTAAERWNTLAEKGDVRGLLAEAARAHDGLINYSDLGDQLSKALDVLVRNDPAALARFLTDGILATAGKLVVRAELLLAQQLRGEYEDRQRGRRRVAESELDVFALEITALHVHVAKLLQLNAITQRVAEQARKLRLANDKVEAKKTRPSKPTRRQRRSTSRPQPMTTSSRIGEGLP